MATDALRVQYTSCPLPTSLPSSALPCPPSPHSKGLHSCPQFPSHCSFEKSSFPLEDLYPFSLEIQQKCDLSQRGFLWLSLPAYIRLLLSYSLTAPPSLWGKGRLFKYIILYWFVYLFPGVKPRKPGALSLWFTIESGRHTYCLHAEGSRTALCQALCQALGMQSQFCHSPWPWGIHSHLMRKKN